MKKDFLEKIYTIIGEKLEKEDFVPNKALNLYKYNNKNYCTDFVLDIKDRDNGYLQHIKFEFTNKMLEKKFKEFDNKLRMKKGGEAFSFNRPSLEITDWKIILKKNNLVITNFWFHYFDTLNEVDEAKIEYIQFADLIIQLKSKLQDTLVLKEYLLDNYNEYHLRQYLCLAYINQDNLDEAYQKVQEISKDYLEYLKKDIKDFYELLIEAKR